MKTHIQNILIVIALLGFIGLGVTNLAHTTQKLQIQKIELKSREAKLIELNARYDELLHTQVKTDQERQEQIKKIQELESEKKRLQAELQAKANNVQSEQQRLARAAQNASGTQTANAAGGKMEWFKLSGIADSDFGYVDYIISHESGWNPYARNASSGAGGLPQALPYSKTGCAWGDAVCQLKWANSYAVGRYGSWAKAYNFWVSNRYW